MNASIEPNLYFHLPFSVILAETKKTLNVKSVFSQ